MNHSKDRSNFAPEPEIRRLARDEIPNSAIHQDALRVLSRLTRAGHEAYLVGGCVRDLMLGRRPKDFDLATSAHPRQVKRLFRNGRIIGRRFKLVHVVYGRHIIETATFRGEPRETGDGDDVALLGLVDLHTLETIVLEELAHSERLGSFLASADDDLVFDLDHA